MTITNNTNIPLSLAVWLLHDDYDYQNEPNYISATGIMKPIRQIILPKRIPPEKQVQDVEDFVASALGKSIHDSIEKAWMQDPQSKLKRMGYPQDVIDRVLVNPTDEELKAAVDPIPIYLEQRLYTDFLGYRLGGKFDQITEGIIKDFKSTSAYTWLYGTKDDEHSLQMSIYNWLDSRQPIRKITEDFCEVNYIFTDWQKMSAKTNPNYPQKRVESKTLKLLSLAETEDFIVDKISTMERYMDADELDIPECTDEELWRSDPQYKYFSNPLKTDGRATRNFPTLNEAKMFMNSKGNKGTIITVPGEVKRCGYCSAFDACTQKDQYL